MVTGGIRRCRTGCHCFSEAHSLARKAAGVTFVVLRGAVAVV